MIDTHTHLYLCDQEIESLIKASKAAGVTKMINVAVDIETAKKSHLISEKYDYVFPTIGIYPTNITNANCNDIRAELDQNNTYVAIGEIGLDYKYDNTDKKMQIDIFTQQLDIAREYSLPIIIHNRQADEDMAYFLNKYKDVDTILHCYSSSWEFAQKIIRDNLKFSFAGMITYSKKGKIVNTIKNLPQKYILAETDCPYLTPRKYQGQRNQPSFIKETILSIAKFKQLEFEEVVDFTTRNANEIFNLT